MERSSNERYKKDKERYQFSEQQKRMEEAGWWGQKPTSVSRATASEWVRVTTFFCNSSSSCFSHFYKLFRLLFRALNSTQPVLYSFLVSCFPWTCPFCLLDFQFPLLSDMSVRILLFSHFLLPVFPCLSLAKCVIVLGDTFVLPINSVYVPSSWW